MGFMSRKNSGMSGVPSSQAKRRLAVLKSSPSSPKRRKTVKRESEPAPAPSAADVAASSSSGLRGSLQSDGSHGAVGSAMQEGNGLLSGKRPTDVSSRDLQKMIGMATDAKGLFGDVSASEIIELTFQWFGRPSIDLPWFFERGAGKERSIVPSEHNRELQEPRRVKLNV